MRKKLQRLLPACLAASSLVQAALLVLVLPFFLRWFFSALLALLLPFACQACHRALQVA
jgi:hypothetical protein